MSVFDDGIEDILRASNGVKVTHSGATTWGHLDEIGIGGGLVDPREMGAFDSPAIAGVRKVLTIETGKLPDVDVNEQVVADGTTYEVRDVPRVRADGTTLLLLGNV